MTETLICNVCEKPSGFGDSRELAMIPPNVLQFRHESFTMWRCISCDSLHTKEAVDLDRYYRGYHVHAAPLGLHLRTTYRNRIKQLARFGWSREQAILDYGCGAGSFVQYLQRAGYDAHGYDPFSGGWSAPERLKRQYDVLVNYDVIEHVEDPRATLQTWSKLVRPGGLIVVGTPNAANISLAEAWLPEIHVPYHRHILSEQALRRLGESLGLRVHCAEHIYLQDSLVPTVNSRFVWNYIRWACGGIVDHVWGPPRLGAVLKQPRLWFDALWGYFFPYRNAMTVCFQTPSVAASSA